MGRPDRALLMQRELARADRRAVHRAAPSAKNWERNTRSAVYDKSATWEYCLLSDVGGGAFLLEISPHPRGHPVYSRPISCRAMTSFWICGVPSPICSPLTSRSSCCRGISLDQPTWP